VLSLDALRSLGSDNGAFQALRAEVNRLIEAVHEDRLMEAVLVARQALEHAESWLTRARKAGQPALEAGARRFSLTLGRVMELALLLKHAQWSQDNETDGRATAAARRFALNGVDLIIEPDVDDARLLLQ
jgi:hypothetical protein